MGRSMPCLLTAKKDGDPTAPKDPPPDIVRAKICPSGMTYNALSALTCTYCGFEWPKPEPKHGDKAEAEPVMTREIKDRWIKVDQVFMSRHQKFGDGPDSLVIEYLCGLKSYREWFCHEHSGFARAKFERWWTLMGGVVNVPMVRTIEQALDHAPALHMTRAIMIVREGKFWRVVKRRVERPNGTLMDLDDKLVSRPVFEESPV
jgi:DNA repair protein RadD